MATHWVTWRQPEPWAEGCPLGSPQGCHLLRVSPGQRASPRGAVGTGHMCPERPAPWNTALVLWALAASPIKCT